jgi:hypothetical protein
LIEGLDVDTVRASLKALVARAPAPETAPKTQPAPEDRSVSEREQWLSEGDREVAARDGSAAAAVFQRVLSKYPNEPRALYGLAIADVLSGKAEDARDLFEKIVLSAPGSAASAGNPDPAVLAWSHVYLGRIHDLSDERDDAIREYLAARAVEGAPEAARSAAQSGIDNPYKPARAGEGSQQ